MASLGSSTTSDQADQPPAAPALPETPPSPENLGELKQSVGKKQLQDTVENFSDMSPEKRKEALKHVKAALIGVGAAALIKYITSDEKEEPEQTDESQSTPAAEEDEESGTQEAEDESEQDVEKVKKPKKAKKEPVVEKEPEAEIVPYKPGTKEAHVSPDKEAFRVQVERIYAQEETLFSTDNLDGKFGRDYIKFIVKEDPVTHEQPITFLGKPINEGINFMMLPFLKIAERKIMDLDLNYLPKEDIRGFQDRNMAVRDKKGELGYDPKIPSFHKYGLAVDIDPDFNWPKDGRGTIPDEVIIAMAEAGFACGSISNPSFYYLMNDTMHYQLRFPPDSAAGQKIIDASPVGRGYWKAVQPLLDQIR